MRKIIKGYFVGSFGCLNETHPDRVGNRQLSLSTMAIEITLIIFSQIQIAINRFFIIYSSSFEAHDWIMVLFK